MNVALQAAQTGQISIQEYNELAWKDYNDKATERGIKVCIDM
jgi:hypothetical protein